MAPTLGALTVPSAGHTPGQADSLCGSVDACLRASPWAVVWEPRARGGEGGDGSRPAFSFPSVTEFWQTHKGGLSDFRCDPVLERERNREVPFRVLQETSRLLCLLLS